MVMSRESRVSQAWLGWELGTVAALLPLTSSYGAFAPKTAFSLLTVSTTRLSSSLYPRT